MKLYFLLLVLIPAVSVSQTITCSEKICAPPQIRMYWRYDYGQPIRAMENLFWHDPKLTWVMNAGAYNASFSPLGLYIENGKLLRPIKKVKGSHYNFGRQPQGVFLITKDRKAMVVDIDHPILKSSQILYASQSGPLLVWVGEVNPKLTHSPSAQKRNGVGILKDGRVLLAVSDGVCTFQQFAQYFKNRGCMTAMYLDGVVSAFADSREAALFVTHDYGPFIGVY